MIVLWITNIEVPEIARHFGRDSFIGGWLANTSRLLSERQEVELHILGKAYENYDEVLINGIYYSSFIEEEADQRMPEIIEAVKPDIIHIWGTEYYHSYPAIKAAENKGLLDKTIVSIQGLITYISLYHYYCFLPERIIKKYTLSGIKNNLTIEKDRNEMLRLSEYERNTLKTAKSCIGRTEWDCSGVKSINKDINYFKCNEIMRSSFYSYKWNFEDCNHFSVFFSQANYPLKGFHIMLEAAGIIKKQYPSFQIRVLGRSIENNLNSYLHDSAYQRYLRELINRYDLWENISWLGNLKEEEMVEEYLKCNVFVCSSSIENSSNSISEAMLLGVPIVASDAGGVKSLMNDKQEGFLYQSDAPYLLAYDVIKMFENPSLAIELGNKARERALVDHDQKANTDRLLYIYKNL